MSQKLEELRQRRQAYDDLLEAEAENIVNEILTKFFEENPRFQSIRWTQYTPFFNDGNACEFGVNEEFDYQLVAKEVSCSADPGEREKDEDEDEDEDYDSDEEDWSSVELDEQSLAALGELETLLCSEQDIMEAAFGDHVRVTATRGQPVQTEDYSDHH